MNGHSEYSLSCILKTLITNISEEIRFRIMLRTLFDSRNCWLVHAYSIVSSRWAKMFFLTLCLFATSNPYFRRNQCSIRTMQQLEANTQTFCLWKTPDAPFARHFCWVFVFFGPGVICSSCSSPIHDMTTVMCCLFYSHWLPCVFTDYITCIVLCSGGCELRVFAFFSPCVCVCIVNACVSQHAIFVKHSFVPWSVSIFRNNLK